jgi:hypothetical protein
MLRHVGFDVLPDVKRLASAKRADVMTPFQQNAVFEPIPYGSAVVLDAGRQLIGCQVGTRGHFSLLQVNGTIRTAKEHASSFFVILNGIMELEMSLSSVLCHLE